MKLTPHFTFNGQSEEVFSLKTDVEHTEKVSTFISQVFAILYLY